MYRKSYDGKRTEKYQRNTNQQKNKKYGDNCF